jgi:16S rRNA G966 N2-methylase RsmD
LDPPYKSDFGKIAINLIEEYDLLNDDGIVIYECDKNTTLDSTNLTVYDEKIYGTIKVYFLRK